MPPDWARLLLTPHSPLVRSGLPGLEAGVEDLGDPLTGLLQVGAGGVVQGEVVRVEGRARAVGDLLEVESGQAAGVGGEGAAAEGDEQVTIAEPAESAGAQ